MKLRKKKKPLLTIGRREFIDIPEFNVFGIEAKIDTGAFTTAIHCNEIMVKEINGKKTLCFKVLDPAHEEYKTMEHRLTDFEERNIKNSFGDYEKRFVIKVIIKLGRKKIRTTVSLANRKNMRYPVLIGRKFLGKKFLVDVSKTHMQSSKA